MSKLYICIRQEDKLEFIFIDKNRTFIAGFTWAIAIIHDMLFIYPINKNFIFYVTNFFKDRDLIKI